ncbi:MAG: hypothetical protein NC344_10265 [Bacteroidales bacterium]|nr:hypothetical protein [Bacteroidales bacterium]MCM1148188.1 hypothetical protein [Bacteroidales bacterium]MCM1207085.1 hypothetical protein [Bacillota bacterium]MCM1510829.1 hypothetical protein [Clostridium sp.]
MNNKKKKENNMKRQPLDIYDDMPPAMRAYITHYGWNFSKHACDYAVKLMKRRNGVTGKEEPLEPWKREQVEELLTKHGVRLESDTLYNSTFVCNMARADYWKSSIEDEKHLAMFIKDYIDDADASPETAFRRWVATMVGNGMPIEWEDIM